MSHCCPSNVKDLVDRGRKVTHPRARDDDCIPSAVRFLGDPKKSPAIVFTKLNVKTLPFDLELFRFDDAIHFRKRRSLGQSAYRMEANSAAVAGIDDPGPKWRKCRGRDRRSRLQPYRRPFGPLLGLACFRRSSAIAKSTCRLNTSTRATNTRSSSPTERRRRDCRPINRRCLGSKA
jgi:hypothetical protein